MADRKSKRLAHTAKDLLPEQFAQMLKNIRIFNHFEMNLLMELWNFVTVLKFDKDATVFQPGDLDDSIYIVQGGQLAVYIKYYSERDRMQKSYLVKEVSEGGTIFSMLSLLDVLTNHLEKIKTVTVKAVQQSNVLKLSMPQFRSVFQKYPMSWLRAIQIIALNLQHVTFDTLHCFLGLSEQLYKTKVLEHNKDTLRHKEDVRRQELKNYDRQLSLDFATNAFAELFEMTSDLERDLIRSKLIVESYPIGYVLMEEGSASTCLFYVLLGKLDVLQRNIEDENNVQTLSKVYIDEYIGNLSVLTGEQSFYTICAAADSMVAIIKKADLYSLMKIKPTIVLAIADKLIKRISGFVRQIDFVLQYEILDPGRELYKQTDKADAIYRVLSGRLRSQRTKGDGLVETVQEFGRHDVVGLGELFTNRLRASTIISSRSSEIAKVPLGLLNMITERYPRVLTRITKLMGNFWFREEEEKVAPKKFEELRPHASNVSTIAAFAIGQNVPMAYFVAELWHSLNSVKKTLLLSSESITKSMGNAALEKVNAFRLMSWLNDQEESSPLVLYQCDNTFNEWTKRCVLQADCILIVANGRADCTVSGFEKELQMMTANVQKELVLLWPSSVNFPSNTIKWLTERDWISSYYHIRVPQWSYTLKSSYNIVHKNEKHFVTPPNKFSQFSRLARILTGCSVGLVLGSGGARGAAHVGMLKAFHESAGIPIDMIGGTSIGAFIAGIYCLCLDGDKVDAQVDPDLIHEKARLWFMDWAFIYDKLWDFTYPITAFCTGACFNRPLERVFGNMKIEDFWIPYFAISLDISTCDIRIHRKGYLPPICSEEDGHVLMDGAYVDNVPAGVMKNMGAWKVIAVDVSSGNEPDLLNYGDSLSGWWVLWRKWFPGPKPIKILDMTEIQTRLSFVTSYKNLEAVKHAPYCFYLNLPLQGYATAEFGSYDKILKIGYDYSKCYFDNLAKSGQLMLLTYYEDSKKEKKLRYQSCAFTDLAAVVCSPKYKSGYDDDVMDMSFSQESVRDDF